MRLVPALIVVAVAGASTASAKLPPPPTEAAVVATGTAPCGFAAFGGELWVGVYETGTVLRLDRTGRVQRRHRVGRFACQVAVDRRAGLGDTGQRGRGGAHRPPLRGVDADPDRVAVGHHARCRLRLGDELRYRHGHTDRPGARFAGSVWISSFAGSDIRRYDP